VKRNPQGFACVFYTLKIKQYHKKLMQRLGVIFCRRLTTNTAFPVFVRGAICS